MAFLSRLVNNLEPSATMNMSEKSRLLRLDGKDVLSMAAGETDFPTNDVIKRAAVDAIHENKTRYTSVAGVPEIHEAIIAYIKKCYDITYFPKNVIVSGGAKQVIYNALRATIDPGDDVVIPAPYWVSYPAMVQLCGGNPVIAQTHAENNFCLTTASLRGSLTSKTKWLVLNSPSNPCGTIYTRQQVQELGEVLKDHPSVHILSDDIYQPLIYEGSFYSMAQLDDLCHRTLTVHGVSKGWNMTGWRLGFGAGSSDLISAMIRIQGQSTSHACSISQWAAIAALNMPDNAFTSQKKVLKERRDMLYKSVNAIAGLSCHKPQGAFYMFVNCGHFLGKRTSGGHNIVNDHDFAMALLEEKNLAVIPGSAFGCEGYVRLSYTLDFTFLEEACTRLKDFCDSCSPSP